MSSASVTVDGGVVGEIGSGLLVLVGAGRGGRTTPTPPEPPADRVHGLRVFPTDAGARSAADLGLPLLVVSQFTLSADSRRGRRPSWSAAAPGEDAGPLVDGAFGARMQVASVNEGPMTLLLEV